MGEQVSTALGSFDAKEPSGERKSDAAGGAGTAGASLLAATASAPERTIAPPSAPAAEEESATAAALKDLVDEDFEAELRALEAE